MKITKFEIVDFRNLSVVGGAMPAGGALVLGANGTGKSNFLDALRWVLSDRTEAGRGGLAGIWPAGNPKASPAVVLVVETEKGSHRIAKKLEKEPAGGNCSNIAIDGEEATARAVAETLWGREKVFGLPVARIATEPDYFPGLCLSTEWKKARRFIMDLAGWPSPQECAGRAGVELPEGCGDPAGEAEDAGKVAREAKARARALWDVAYLNEGSPCPSCGQPLNPEHLEDARKRATEAGKAQAAAEAKAQRLADLARAEWQLAEEKLGKIGLPFMLLDGKGAETCEPVIGGLPYSRASEGERMALSVKLQKRICELAGIERGPVIIDECGRLSPEGLRKVTAELEGVQAFLAFPSGKKKGIRLEPRD